MGGVYLLGQVLAQKSNPIVEVKQRFHFSSLKT
jgi:hypothetical protein